MRLTATNVYGEDVSAETIVRILPATLTADFKTSKNDISAGERISFLPCAVMPGARYEWSMPGADSTEAFTATAAATYEKAGSYRVKLRAADPVSGQKAKATLHFKVHAVAPQPAFDLSPRIIRRGEEFALTDRSRFAPTSWQWLVETVT